MNVVCGALALICVLYIAACEIERNAPVIDEAPDSGAEDASAEDAG